MIVPELTFAFRVVRVRLSPVVFTDMDVFFLNPLLEWKPRPPPQPNALSRYQAPHLSDGFLMRWVIQSLSLSGRLGFGYLP